MAYTYSKLASTTVGAGGATDITFSNIPQNYTDLVLKLSTRSDRSTGTATSVQISFNGSTSSFTDRSLEASGTGVSSYTANPSDGTIGYTDQNNLTSNTFGSNEIYIPNYTSSNYKSLSTEAVSENNSSTSNYMDMRAVLWSNVTPITSIRLKPGSFNFMQYSTATLYGIRVEL